MRWTIGLLLTLVALQGVSADEGQIKFRQATMDAIGGHMGAMVGIFRQEVPYMDQLPLHAGAIRDLSGIVATLFPEGSAEGGETDALPAIWEEPDAFAERIGNFQDAATALDAAVSTGDGVGEAFQALGQACKGCHDNFRAE